MRNLKYSFISSITLFLFSISCVGNNSPEEPTQWFHIFRLLDKEGQDFFSTHPDYKREKMRACVEVNDVNFCLDENPLNEINDFYINQIDGKTYFSLFNPRASFNSTVYLDFGNGDSDTLTFSSRPEEIPNPFWTNIREFNFFYNGRKVHTYDLRQKENGLRGQLLIHNMPNDTNRENEWVVITITKEERDSD